jgi:uncharacterized protein with GYD domain
MPFYLYEGSYTSEAWAKLLSYPVDLTDSMRPSVEKLGGKIIACFVKLSSGDAVGFIEFPDDLTANAWLMLMSSNNDLKHVEIMPILTTQEGVMAMQRAGSASSSHPSPR